MLGVFEMVLLVCFIVQVGFAADTNANEASGDKYAPNRNSVAIGKRATCPFTRVLNIVSGRVPPEIPTVKCKCPGNRCSSVGDFRCLEGAGEADGVLSELEGRFPLVGAKQDYSRDHCLCLCHEPSREVA
ncbi:hypothetical protein MRX96_024702 [Rhipicephalus microplus]